MWQPQTLRDDRFSPVTYDGKTTVGGPAQTRQTSELEITKLAVGRMDNNAYLLRSRPSGASLLIDAAAEPDRLLALTGDKLDGVLTTHGHKDHWSALRAVVDSTGARTYASREDAVDIPVPTDVFTADGDTVRVGEVELTAVHLVGHTAGSIALIHRDADGSCHVFTGDCLFPGGVGRTTPETFRGLLDGVRDKLFGELPDDAWVYPGHGFDTTIGAERPQLDEWSKRGW